MLMDLLDLAVIPDLFGLDFIGLVYWLTEDFEMIFGILIII
jgi:hypothetical protein